MRIGDPRFPKGLLPWLLIVNLVPAILLGWAITGSTPPPAFAASTLGAYASGETASQALDAAMAAPGVQINPTTIVVSEHGDGDHYDVSLTSQPNASVNIHVAANAQVTTEPPELVFTKDNWDETQTVTVRAVDDARVEGFHAGTVSHSAQSKDQTYDGINIADVLVRILDNDEAGLEIAPTALTVPEPDGVTSFTVTLTSEPFFSVTIPVTVSSIECRLSTTAVVLTEATWAPGASVQVAAVDDAIKDGNQLCLVQTGPSASADPLYDGLDVDNVAAWVLDDDEAGIRASPPTLTISEPSQTGTLTLTLLSQPVSTVTLSLDSQSDECQPLTTSVTLSEEDWLTGTNVAIQAIDDGVRDGNQACPVLVQTQSPDPNYTGLEATLPVIVLDNETVWRVNLPLIPRVWPPTPQTPVLYAIANSDGDGAYTIHWDATARAESYFLQEATDPGFAATSLVYSGGATSFPVSARGPSRYYYRVRASNGWGTSAWSRTQFTDVVWELEPNNIPPGQANGPLVSGVDYSGNFPSASDVRDFYYFDMDASHAISLSLRQIPVGRDYTLILRDARLGVVAESLQPGNSDEHITIGAQPTGRYFIEVYRLSTGISSQPYRLQANYQ